MSSIINRKIRIALVGCGRISGKHFEAIERHANDVELVAVCDINPDKLAAAVDQTGANPYETLDKLLEYGSFDLVVLATPSGLHASQTIKIAKAGFHIMTEKPMATRWKDGIKMVEVCDQENVRLFVVKQNRRNTTLRLLKNAIRKKRFGRIYMVNLNVFWTRPQEYYDNDSWRGTWEFDGGALMNQASHYVDLLDWIVGPIESVHAYAATLDRAIQVEDSAVLNIKWRSGTLGSMNVTMLTYPENLEGSITILGEKGTVRIGGVAVNEILHWEFSEKDEDDEKIKNANYETTSVYGLGHPSYYYNVIQVLRGKAEPETDGREGLQSLEIIIASYLSARDGKVISLPLEY